MCDIVQVPARQRAQSVLRVPELPSAREAMLCGCCHRRCWHLRLRCHALSLGVHPGSVGVPAAVRHVAHREQVLEVHDFLAAREDTCSRSRWELYMLALAT